MNNYDSYNIQTLDFYNSYHNNPINKAIHFFCIPLIVFSTNELLKEFYIANELITYPGLTNIYKIYITWFCHQLYCIYYFYKFGLYPGLLMMVYFTAIRYLSLNLNIKKKNALKIFTFAWIMQFIGHAIEGNKPALLDSISQTILEAPLFSFQYIFPNLLKS